MFTYFPLRLKVKEGRKFFDFSFHTCGKAVYKKITVKRQLFCIKTFLVFSLPKEMILLVVK